MPASQFIRDTLLTAVEAGLREDAPEGDITAAHLPLAGVAARGEIRCKRDGVAAGFAVLKEIGRLRLPDGQPCGIAVQEAPEDGAPIHAGTVVARLTGGAAELLLVERTLLNLLCHLSGIATLTAAFVKQVAGTNAVICDTRKTLPGMRYLHKYAVRCGGGTSHRLGLSDEAMIKENHLHLAGLGLADAVRMVKAHVAPRRLTCEVESLEELELALGTPADCILLDDFSLAGMRAAVGMRDASGKRVLLEASGGVNLGTVAEIAATGVDRISVGALTHSAPSLDLSLKIFRAG